MIYGNINKIGDLNKYPQIIQKALQFLKSNDLKSFTVGKHERDDFFFMVQEMPTIRFSESKMESHKEHLDIQILVEGLEKINYCTYDENLEILEAYDPQKDIVFYKNPEKEHSIKMLPGDFMIFFPEDLHRPFLNYDENTSISIKKIILKIKCNKI